ncbi:Vacuolar protein sorting-associated protein 28 -like protein [Trichinella nativa]|uniref:Vacuolar protein sorting-associated protein 28 homolog n=1 Tax=Trichinella nativa TaxID=6335 RepID=A0A0V1LI58_9BILA|nr:Vacuolar protein sorting-associated protein 28 -like protein [Trichinella nativa]
MANLYTEVKLRRNAAERERFDNLAELYATINTLECLEKAYIRDIVSPKEYTAQCSKLLVQVKANFVVVQPEFSEIEYFMKAFEMNCPSALERIKDGKPITIKDDKGNTSKCIADIVSLFITIMDKLKLEIKAVDELHPDLRDLVDTMNRMTSLPTDFEGKAKVKPWFELLDSMRATEELDDEQARQMKQNCCCVFFVEHKFFDENVNIASIVVSDVEQNFEAIFLLTMNDERDTLMNSLYLIIGLASTLANGLLLLLVWRKHRVKKKYIFLTGFAVGALIEGFGYFTAAVRRFYFDTFFDGHLVDLSKCLASGIHMLMFLAGDTISTSSLLLISLERLLAVKWTKLYQRLSVRVMNCILLVPFVWGFSDVLTFLLISIQLHGVVVNPHCFVTECFTRTFYIIHNSMSIVLGYSVVIIYAIIFLWLRIHKTQSSTIRAIQLRRETKITKRIFLLIVMTIFFHIFPQTLSLAFMNSANWLKFDKVCWGTKGFNLSLNAAMLIVVHPGLKAELCRVMNDVRRCSIVKFCSCQKRNSSDQHSSNNFINDPNKSLSNKCIPRSS